MCEFEKDSMKNKGFIEHSKLNLLKPLSLPFYGHFSWSNTIMIEKKLSFMVKLSK